MTKDVDNEDIFVVCPATVVLRETRLVESEMTVVLMFARLVESELIVIA